MIQTNLYLKEANQRLHGEVGRGEEVEGRNYKGSRGSFGD